MELRSDLGLELLANDNEGHCVWIREYGITHPVRSGYEHHSACCEPSCELIS
jgi:hypothetical protein